MWFFRSLPAAIHWFYHNRFKSVRWTKKGNTITVKLPDGRTDIWLRDERKEWRIKSSL